MEYPDDIGLSSQSQSFSEGLESSQPSSYFSSPVMTTIDQLLGTTHQPESQSQSTDSQPSSLPSPVTGTLDHLLGHNIENMDHFYSKLENLNLIEKICSLRIIKPQLDKNDLSHLSDDLVNHLGRVLRTTSNGRLPQNIKSWISQQPLIGPCPKIKPKFRGPNQNQKCKKWRQPQNIQSWISQQPLIWSSLNFNLCTGNST